jgi:hypothetical protein
MRKVFLIICCAAAMFPVIGCSEGSQEGTVATTDQDEIDAYNAMINDPNGPGEDTEEDE